MKKISTFLAAALILGAVSCQVEEQNEWTQGSDIARSTVRFNFKAAVDDFEVDAQTKASADAIVRVTWRTGDEVSVVNVTKGTILGGKLAATDNGSIVTFSGTVSGTLEKGDKLAYVYPAISDNEQEISFSKTAVDLSEQSFDGSNPANVAFNAWSEDTFGGFSTLEDGVLTYSNDLQVFELATCYMTVNMSTLTPGAAITSVEISEIGSGFYWTISDGEFAVDSSYPAGGISVDCSNFTSSSRGLATVRVCAPPCAAADSRRLGIVLDDGFSPEGYASAFPAAERQAAAYYNINCTGFERISIPEIDNGQISPYAGGEDNDWGDRSDEDNGYLRDIVM